MHQELNLRDKLTINDVLSCTCCSQKIFSELEVLATLFASAIHDVDHPGVTNQYLVNTGKF